MRVINACEKSCGNKCPIKRWRLWGFFELEAPMKDTNPPTQDDDLINPGEEEYGEEDDNEDEGDNENEDEDDLEDCGEFDGRDMEDEANAN
jgi:hypothetical protein